MGRIINAESHLSNLLKEGQPYYIGFGLTTITEEGKKLTKLKDLIDSKISSFTVTGKKGPLKENTKGKFVREQPESKVTIEKHIEYYSNYHGRTISYDRDFHIWKKIILHKFELNLYKSISPQGEAIIHFPKFIMESKEDSFLRAKAAMNITNILGGYFQIYDSNFEPIIKITGHLEKHILHAGQGNVKDKLEDIKDRLQNGEYGNQDQSGNSYRFALLQDCDITDIYDGFGGFNEYLQFEFANDDIVILENLKSGNATYIFKLSKFDKQYILDKQNAKDHPSFVYRIIHHNISEWEKTIFKYISKKPGEVSPLV